PMLRFGDTIPFPLKEEAKGESDVGIVIYDEDVSRRMSLCHEPTSLPAHWVMGIATISCNRNHGKLNRETSYAVATSPGCSKSLVWRNQEAVMVPDGGRGCPARWESNVVVE